MPEPRPVFKSSLAAPVCAPFAVALTTWVLLHVQSVVSRGEGAYVHPYTIGYVLPLALLARLGGRGPGLLGLLLSFACSQFVLMAPHYSWRVSHPSDVTELLFLTLAGLLVVVGLDAVRRNARLLAESERTRERLGVVVAEQQRAERNLRTVAESIPQLVWTTTPEGWHDSFNERWYAYTGMTLAETQGWGWSHLLHPDDRERTIARWKHSLETGEPYRIEYRFRRASDGAFRWFIGEALPLRDEAGRVLRWFGTCTEIEDQKRLERDTERLLAETQARAEREALVNQIGQSLRRTLDPDEVQAAATRALGEALAADRCYHIWYDADFGAGDIGPDWHPPAAPSLTGRHDFAAVGYDPRAVFAGGGTAILEDVRVSGLPPSVAQTLEALGHRAVIGVPLYDGPRLVAALAVTMADGPRAWTPDEVALVEAVATQTRSAVESARAAQREARIASTLQDALQPPLPERVSGLDLDSYYKPALREANIGGDFHDAFPLEKGVFALVVGDLSGKGLAAAAQVATVRNMLRFALYQGLYHGNTLAASVSELNRVVTEQELLPGFLTLFVALYNAADLSITYVSCGQEPALVRRAVGGAFDELPPTGPVLGANAAAVYDQGALTLTPGDALAIFTDGLTEAGRTRNEFLGVSGLADLLRQSPGTGASALVADVMAGVERYAQGRLHDDVCLLVAVAGGRPATSPRS